MDVALRYTITGSNGDEAEAVDFQSALCAARTLVDDGSASADVHTADFGRWVAAAERRPRGVAIRVVQGGPR